MLFSEWIRRVGFWAQDFISGSKVRKHYVDIKKIMENGSNPDVSKLQEDYLNNILTYATEHVEYYKKLKGFSSIKSFPLIDKNIIRNNYASFQSSEFAGSTVVNMHTSGSTGTPFVVRQDINKRKRVYAEMIYFWGKAGYQIGMKYVFFRIWTAFNRQSRLSALARNIIMCDAGRHDEVCLENIRNTLKSDRKIKMFIGFSGFLDSLVNYLLACGDTSEMYNINTIISFAEALPYITREKLRKVFNCNIVALYSNQENGMLAQECVQNKEFHVNSASYHIELLKIDSDEPASVGELARIVVTDLFNRAMPLIRYDIGDIGIGKKEAECGWQSQVFSSIQGRLLDFIFDTGGNKISPQTICLLMWPYDKLIQFQFIQEGAKQYTLKLNGAEGNYEDVIFLDLCKGLLGKDAEIAIEHVHEIPVLESGKRRIVVNNYNQQNSLP